MKFVAFLTLTIVFRFSVHAEARVLKISVGQIPQIAPNRDSGLVIEFIKAMQRAYPEGKIEYDVYPFKRSVDMVLSGESDAHLPILKFPGKSEKELGFAYSTANIWNVIFSLYANKNVPGLNPSTVTKFKIEAAAAEARMFAIGASPSTCMECSLKKVNAGRIDGFLFPSFEGDQMVKNFHLTDVRSFMYGRYEGKFILPLGDKGKETDKLLTLIIERTKKNGDYARTIGKINEQYKEWRPVNSEPAPAKK